MTLSEKYFFSAQSNLGKLSLLIIDLDHFKKINDTYGHSFGDMALISFTDRCSKELREFDILGRLGGEEFAIILPDTDADKAEVIANRIRNSISNMTIYNSKLKTKVNISVSIGVSSYEHQESIEKMIDEADEALYFAKRNGRNTVVRYNNKVISISNRKREVRSNCVKDI